MTAPIPIPPGIEALAECWDCVGLGDVLRDVWLDLMPALLPPFMAALLGSLSGASDELEYYGGQAA